MSTELKEEMVRIARKCVNDFRRDKKGSADFVSGVLIRGDGNEQNRFFAFTGTPEGVDIAEAGSESEASQFNVVARYSDGRLAFTATEYSVENN